MDIDTLKICYALKKYFDNYKYYIIFNRIIKKPAMPIESLCEELQETKETIRKIQLEGLRKIKSLKEDDYVGFNIDTRVTPMGLYEICGCLNYMYYLLYKNERKNDYYIIYQSIFNKMEDELIAEQLKIKYGELLSRRFLIRLDVENNIGNPCGKNAINMKGFLLQKYNIREIMNINLDPSKQLDININDYEINKEDNRAIS